ncbi:transglutaminase-like cysteine peptidase [Sphingomicrobium nitratireducens]|uniref:transglutaminase-like cysteine peptidase n=1 Tax=Sphingomicrobium nitratireducens TaxID=2964666 RepID=UPI00223F262F|nr:transglutaminase-like cysteine peptidase [Sphingomicrobium nitratireducens]
MQRLVLGLLLLAMTIGTVAAKAHAAPVDLPFGAGLAIERGAIADRGRSFEAMIATDARVARLVQPVEGLTEARQLAYVQAVIGEMIAWRSDAQLYASSDRWASPRETLARRAGDCEDIAILKLASLASLGFSHDRLALVVGTDAVRGDHAIAAVRSGGGWQLLDDDGRVRSAAANARFAPVYSLVGGQAYLHGTSRLVRPAAP